jgi:Leucine rich repeat variant
MGDQNLWTKGCEPRRWVVIALASDESRTHDELVILGKHLSWRVRRAVASNPRTPFAVVDSLATDPSARVRVRVAGHPMTSPMRLADLSLERLRETRRRVALNENTPPEVQLRLARDDSSDVRAALAQNRTLDRQAIDLLSRDENHYVIGAVAERNDLNAEVAERLSRHSNQRIRTQVIQRVPLSIDSQKRLGKSKDSTIRISLARNPHLSPDVHRRLLKCRWWQVRAAALEHPLCHPSDIVSGLRAAVAGVQFAAAASPVVREVDPGQLEETLFLLPWSACLALAANPSTPTNVVDRFIHSGLVRQHNTIRLGNGTWKWVAGRALGNANASPDLVDWVADLPDLEPWAQGQLARNPSLAAERRDALLAWLALGGASNGDPTYDPCTDVGHPGDPRHESAYEALERLAKDEGHAGHPIEGVRVRWATGTKISHTQLRHYAEDPSVLVRRRAASYGPQRDTSLKVMRHDEDDYVRRRGNTAPSVDVSLIRTLTGAPFSQQSKAGRLTLLGLAIATMAAATQLSHFSLFRSADDTRAINPYPLTVPSNSVPSKSVPSNSVPLINWTSGSYRLPVANQGTYRSVQFAQFIQGQSTVLQRRTAATADWTINTAPIQSQRFVNVLALRDQTGTAWFLVLLDPTADRTDVHVVATHVDGAITNVPVDVAASTEDKANDGLLIGFDPGAESNVTVFGVNWRVTLS